MNLGGLVNEVNRRAGVDYSDDAMVGLINEAIADITTLRDWPWNDATQTETGDGTTNNWVTPPLYIRTQSVAVDAYSARRIAPEDYDTFSLYQDRPGVYCYALMMGGIYFQPIPTAGVSVVHRYTQAEAPLVALSDVPNMPDRFHPVIVAATTKRIAMRMRDNKLFEMLSADLDSKIDGMKDEVDRGGGIKRVRVRAGFGWA